MSLLSMTGFGRAVATESGFRAEAELSSVNRKQFDCVMTLPVGLAALEEPCRTLVHAAISRGRVQLFVKVAPEGPSAAALDEEAVRAAAARLRRAAAVADIATPLTVADLALVPGLFANAPTPDPDAARPAVLAAVRAALASFHAMRTHEGEALGRDLRARVNAMRALRDAIAARAPAIPLAYRDALRKRLEALRCPLPADDPALAREVALLADRCDVSEELTRLSAHFDHALRLFDGPEPCGRKLDFLAQEMNRESNTIGSKAQDADVAAAVIDLKALVETFREQVQNLE